jgi:hypothetical protein
VATRNQISRLAARIESLGGTNAPQVATTSVINIPTGMDQQLVLAKHRERWPVTGNGRNPVLVVWLSIGAVHDPRDDPAGSHEPSPYCDDVSWREVASEEKPVCRASGGNAQD